MSLERSDLTSVTLSFENFWAWLQAHSNCVLRAGTPEVVLFDHDDYHWHMSAEDEGVLLVQLIRGKELVGEFAGNNEMADQKDHVDAAQERKKQGDAHVPELGLHSQR